MMTELYLDRTLLAVILGFVLDLLLGVHKHTGLACQSQISRQLQTAFLGTPGSWCPTDLIRIKTRL